MQTFLLYEVKNRLSISSTSKIKQFQERISCELIGDLHASHRNQCTETAEPIQISKTEKGYERERTKESPTEARKSLEPGTENLERSEAQQ